jgi:hypothetical protein
MPRQERKKNILNYKMEEKRNIAGFQKIIPKFVEINF